MIDVTPIETVRADLALIGLQLRLRFDDHQCPVCRELDGSYDADLLATSRRGAAYIVSYRRQDDYDYQTITIRQANDRGNEDVQALKIKDRRSIADLTIQSYPSGIAWAETRDIRATMLLDKPCGKHKALLTGDKGQRLLVFCSWCVAMHYKPRQASRTWGEMGWATEALYREWG